MLPETPILLCSINLEAGAEDIETWLRYVGIPEELIPSAEARLVMASTLIQGALSDTLPVEREERSVFPSPPGDDEDEFIIEPKQRYVTDWLPVEEEPHG